VTTLKSFETAVLKVYQELREKLPKQKEIRKYQHRRKIKITSEKLYN
jgi:hypothetical protein